MTLSIEFEPSIVEEATKDDSVFPVLSTVASPNSIESVPISEKINQITDKHFLIQLVSMLFLLKSIMFLNSVHTIFHKCFQVSAKSEITIKFSEVKIW